MNMTTDQPANDLVPRPWWHIKRFDWKHDSYWAWLFIYVVVVHSHVEALLANQTWFWEWLPVSHDRSMLVFIFGLSVFILLAKIIESALRKWNISPSLKRVAAGLIEGLVVQIALWIWGIFLFGIINLNCPHISFVVTATYFFVLEVSFLAPALGGYHCALRIGSHEVLAGVGAAALPLALILKSIIFSHCSEFSHGLSLDLIKYPAMAAVYLALGGLGGSWAAKRQKSSRAEMAQPTKGVGHDC